MKPSSLATGFLCIALLSCSAKNDAAGTISPDTQAQVTDAEKPAVPATEIPLITVSANGEEQITKMPAVDYRKHLGNIFPAVEAAVMPAVKQTKDSNPFGLRTVVVGVGLKIGLGGSIVGWGAQGGIKLAFSNDAKPSIP